jgi:hypothetical protein
MSHLGDKLTVNEQVFEFKRTNINMITKQL